MAKDFWEAHIFVSAVLLSFFLAIMVAEKAPCFISCMDDKKSNAKIACKTKSDMNHQADTYKKDESREHNNSSFSSWTCLRSHSFIAIAKKNLNVISRFKYVPG